MLAKSVASGEVIMVLFRFKYFYNNFKNVWVVIHLIQILCQKRTVIESYVVFNLSDHDPLLGVKIFGDLHHQTTFLDNDLILTITKIE